MSLWRIKLPYAVGGVITNSGTVVKAPPLFKWMVGKQIEEVTEWVEKKGGTIKRNT